MFITLPAWTHRVARVRNDEATLGAATAVKRYASGLSCAVLAIIVYDIILQKDGEKREHSHSHGSSDTAGHKSEHEKHEPMETAHSSSVTTKAESLEAKNTATKYCSTKDESNMCVDTNGVMMNMKNDVKG